MRSFFFDSHSLGISSEGAWFKINLKMHKRKAILLFQKLKQYITYEATDVL